jgi:hypothetical protein
VPGMGHVEGPHYSATLEIVAIILILIEVLKSLGEKFRIF